MAITNKRGCIGGGEKAQTCTSGDHGGECVDAQSSMLEQGPRLEPSGFSVLFSACFGAARCSSVHFSAHEGWLVVQGLANGSRAPVGLASSFSAACWKRQRLPSLATESPQVDALSCQRAQVPRVAVQRAVEKERAEDVGKRRCFFLASATPARLHHVAASGGHSFSLRVSLCDGRSWVLKSRCRDEDDRFRIESHGGELLKGDERDH